ncbi:MAG: hypothetical protein HYV15_00795, partial [Elusimicrobia bacterium]|nr:hypothetical protein [Elusimicrobiota bacterium]
MRYLLLCLVFVSGWERFLERHPDDFRRHEASFRAGRLYAEVLGRCPEARHHFEAAARSSGPFTGAAVLGLMSCPDYFPLAQGARWTFVDTLSGGANMRLELQVLTATASAQGLVTGKFYAGETAFRDYRRHYDKEDWSVWETQEGVRSPILRWPYLKGRSWAADQPPGPVTYTVEDDAAKVSTKAGSYTDCLKIRTQVKGFDSWVYDYYCPGV